VLWQHHIAQFLKFLQTLSAIGSFIRNQAGLSPMVVMVGLLMSMTDTLPVLQVCISMTERVFPSIKTHDFPFVVTLFDQKTASASIVSSYAWSTITQSIDIAALSTINVNIVASITYKVSYRGTGCCTASNYQDWGQISIDFLDTSSSLLYRYDTGEFQNPGDDVWRQNIVSFTSANFNITRLRYAVITLRGKDNERWSSQYGIAYNSPELTFLQQTNSFIGYVGPTCTTPVTCYGFAWNNPAVCGGHGLCQGVDYCQCNAGYYGVSCTKSMCNGDAIVWGR